MSSDDTAKELAESNLQHEACKTENKKLTTRNEELRKANISKQTENKKLKDTMVEKDKLIDEMRTKLDNQVELYTQLQALQNLQAGRCESMQIVNDEIKANIPDSSEEMRTQLDNLMTENNKLKDENAKLTEQINSKQETHGEKEMQMQLKQIELTETNKKIEKEKENLTAQFEVMEKK